MTRPVAKWRRSHRYDPAGCALADRHYSRRTVGAPQFIKPGRHLALITTCTRALWVTCAPLSEYTRHPWPGAWECSHFRNEGAGGLSSELITSAIAHTRWELGEIPALGMVTWVNVRKVKPKTDPGHCFRRAGFLVERTTGKGLLELRMPARRIAWIEPMPHEREEAHGQTTMFDRVTRVSP